MAFWVNLDYFTSLDWHFWVKNSPSVLLKFRLGGGGKIILPLFLGTSEESSCASHDSELPENSSPIDPGSWTYTWEGRSSWNPDQGCSSTGWKSLQRHQRWRAYRRCRQPDVMRWCFTATLFSSLFQLEFDTQNAPKVSQRHRWHILSTAMLAGLPKGQALSRKKYLNQIKKPAGGGQHWTMV